MAEKVENKKKKGGKKALVIIIILVVLGLAAAAYFLYFRGGVEGSCNVQKVSDILRQNNYPILSDRYSGIVEARNVVKYTLDDDKTVDECFVAAGDLVQPGTPLFSYDMDKLSMTRAQLRIDYETKISAIEGYNDEIASLEKTLKKAKAKSKAELNIQLQTAKLNLMKDSYEAETKKKELDELDAIIADNIVKASITGRVKEINPPDSNDVDSSGSTAYMTILADNDFWIKGTISEQSVYRISEGMRVTVRSRLEKGKIWKGNITKIVTEQPVSNNTSYYYMDNNQESSSKYPFYITLENTDGLMMGQHVYIEFGETGESSGLTFPSFYIVREGDKTFVFAKNHAGRIEKRAVTILSENEEEGTCVIGSGLTIMDSVAYPEDSVKEGLKAVDVSFASEENYASDDMDTGDYADDGMDEGDYGSDGLDEYLNEDVG